MRNEKQKASAGPQPNFSERVPTLLSGLVIDAIRVQQAVFILKGYDRQLKCEACFH